jgi:zinc transport system substrate-binding protein
MDAITLLHIEDNLDPHLWLNTENARHIARQLTTTLSALDADNTERYQRNLQSFLASLDQLDISIGMAFENSRQTPWAVYHHAYRYFERQFLLQVPLALTDNESNQPGVRSVVAMRSAISAQQIYCMLVEPEVNHEQLETLLGQAKLTVKTADVLGQEIAVQQDAYLILMQNLAAAITDCLERN